MKKLSLYVFLVLMFCNVSFADNLKIVDGDTIVLNGEKIRFLGIDTPELKQTCEMEQGKLIDCGFLTKDYLQKLLESEPGDLIIKPIGVDYYQRILIRLFKGKTDIGKKMVEEGMSYSYDSTYKIEETYAKENKLGFWNFFKPPVNPKIWRKEH